MDFNITFVGLKEVIQNLDSFAQKELPFATAKALTKTAQDVQAEIIRILPEKFTLRTAWWKPSNKYGFKIKIATKANLTAEVFTRAPWMMIHETGGARKPQRKFLAIPTDNVRRNKREMITPSQKPKSLRRSFIIKTKSGQQIIMQRVNKKSVKAMYMLEEQAKINPALEFFETGQKIVRKNLLMNFWKALSEAMQSRKV